MKKNFFSIIPFLALSMLSVGCDKNYKFTPTKVAVFADNQLLSYNGGGNVEFNIPYLRYHLNFCKANDVDVIMIGGDLVNNAIDSYYDTFENALKEVYGENEKEYPEFVTIMGNHEWWNTNEEIVNNAAKLFYKHARINTKNLVKKSDTPLPDQPNQKEANYYKVVNGIPFVGLSGTGPTGFINYASQDELKSWLQDISKLPSVKAGGPIFMTYHYAISDVTYTFGQGAVNASSYLDKIIKDYPQVVLFTGDTHFAAANERTINQVDYTSINIGSSCYSRHVNRSATMKSHETYYNMVKGNGSKDVLSGEVAENYNQTPHIHLVSVDEKGNTNFKRYFSALDPKDSKQLGLEWNIPAHKDKESFIYTNERFKNVEWAKKMYNAEGLSWSNEAELKTSYSGGELTVKFPDVVDYNYCEHYKVKVTGDNETIDFDFVSHYYKWEDNPHNYNFKIAKEDLPIGDSYTVKVEAYDCFDNVSLNYLS